LIPVAETDGTLIALYEAELSGGIELKRCISLALCLATIALPIAAQIQIPDSSSDNPQIAYRIFSTWIDDKQERAPREKKAAMAALYSIGGLALGAGAATYFAGDDISGWISGSPMDRELRDNLSLGLAIGGASFIAAGLMVSSVPLRDYRAMYSDVLREPDPEVREAMAVAALKYQADRGKERRITSFVSGLAVPVLAGLLRAGANLIEGDEWTDGVWPSMQWSCWSAANGVVQLFQKTDEERRYARYLTARDAYYGAAAAR
jgi:hypothetical protein